jgi:hypothetical protein
VEETGRYQPKPDKRKWLGEECKIATSENSTAYKTVS